MKAFALGLLALAVLALVCFPIAAGPFGRSGWGPQGCSPVGEPVLSPVAFPGFPAPAPAVRPLDLDPEVTFQWRVYVENPGQAMLYFRDTQVLVGGWDFDKKVYRPWNGYAWGPQRDRAPIEPPIQPLPPAPPIEPVGQPRAEPPNIEQNFGIDPSKLSKENRYYRKGEEVTRADVVAELTKDVRLPDDRNKLRLTIAGGPEDLRKKLVAQYHGDKDLDDVRGKINLWACNATHFSMLDADTGKARFPVSDEKVMVMLESPDGQVLHRCDGTSPKVMQAVLKAAKNYDPSRDPNLTQEDPFLDALKEVPVPVWSASAACIALFSLVVLRKK